MFVWEQSCWQWTNWPEVFEMDGKFVIQMVGAS